MVWSRGEWLDGLKLWWVDGDLLWVVGKGQMGEEERRRGEDDDDRSSTIPEVGLLSLELE